MKQKNKRALLILKKYKDQVWPIVGEYLSAPVYPKQFKISKKYLRFSKFHWGMLKDYPSRKGKYTRATILTLICGAMGQDIFKSFNTAAAMQISEDWILIHDDFEDDSVERRGLPALHKIFGSELAINAGDSLHVLMWKALSNNYTILGNDITNKLLEEFYVMLTRTTLGQTAEIKFTKDNIVEISDEDYLFIVDGKTSYYSVAGPIRLGAIIANANNKQLNHLTEFGKNLGRSYQIIDDILDITSDFAGLKKQTGNDIYESKRTLILGHLLRNTGKKDKKQLEKIILKKRAEKTQKEVDWVIAKMHEYKSIDYAKKIAEEYKKKAEEILKTKLKFLNKEPYLGELKILMDFILNRDH
jgi:geranylgeranyl diphosphate synthase type II